MTATAPHQPHSATSRAAASKIDARTGRKLVLDFLLECGEQGATDEQIQQATGLDGSTERPRRISLVADGFVIDSGRERKTEHGRNAVVWRATGKTIQGDLL